MLSTHFGGCDADVAVFLDVHDLGPVGFDIDVGADAQVDEGGDVKEASALLSKDLQLSDETGHYEQD
jgi:hypothetical protein